MFRNIYLKTLYQRRWATLWWSLGGLGMTLLTIAFYPTLKETFGKALTDVPDSMKALLGDASVYQTLSGFVDLQIFDQMIFLTIILGIIIGTGLIAGEESEGTLQSLLANPVSRTKVYLEKFLALATILAVVSFVILYVGCVLGAAMVGESLNSSDLLLATLNAWLLSLFFGALGYAIGAATGRRGIAGAVAGGLAFLGFMLTALAAGVKDLKFVEKLSPYFYYNNPSPLRESFGGADALLLAGLSLALAIIGYLAFLKRDVSQK